MHSRRYCPLATLRAVARLGTDAESFRVMCRLAVDAEAVRAVGGGGGWCCQCRRGGLSIFILVPATIHPTRSCS